MRAAGVGARVGGCSRPPATSPHRSLAPLPLPTTSHVELATVSDICVLVSRSSHPGTEGKGERVLQRTSRMIGAGVVLLCSPGWVLFWGGWGEVSFWFSSSQTAQLPWTTPWSRVSAARPPHRLVRRCGALARSDTRGLGAILSSGDWFCQLGTQLTKAVLAVTERHRCSGQNPNLVFGP